MGQFSPFKGIQNFVDSINYLLIICAVIIAITVIAIAISFVFGAKDAATVAIEYQKAKSGINGGNHGGINGGNRNGLLDKYRSFH